MISDTSSALSSRPLHILDKFCQQVKINVTRKKIPERFIIISIKIPGCPSKECLSFCNIYTVCLLSRLNKIIKRFLPLLAVKSYKSTIL